jgi:hypothetical protein
MPVVHDPSRRDDDITEPDVPVRAAGFGTPAAMPAITTALTDGKAATRLRQASAAAWVPISAVRVSITAWGRRSSRLGSVAAT